MQRGRWAKVAKFCGYALGVGNLVLLVHGGPTILTLVLAIVLAPFTITSSLKLTAFLACNSLGFAVADSRDRTELLVCAIGGLQPPSAGERYRETILAEVSAALAEVSAADLPDQLRLIRADLIKNAPRTILAAWVRLPRLLRKRAR